MPDVTLSSILGTNDRALHTGTQSLDTTTDSATRLALAPAERTKLAGVATGATANSTDAQLRDRATHTGAQAIATVTGLQAAIDGKLGVAAKAADSELIDGIDSTRILFGSGTTKSTENGIADWNTIRLTGMHDFQPTSTNGPTTGWGSMLHVRYQGTGGDYAWSLAHSLNTDDFYLRNINNGVYGAWRKVWHAGNMAQRDPVTALSIAAGVVNIDLSLGDFYTLSLTSNVTSITFTNLPAAGKGKRFQLRFRQDATGGRTVAFPSSFYATSGSDTTVLATANEYTLLDATTFDQGTRWEYTMQDMALPFSRLMTWNPSDKHADITLSNGNLDAVNGVGGVWRGARGLALNQTAKSYIEYLITVGLDSMSGLADQTHDLTTHLGNVTGGTGGHGWAISSSSGDKITAGTSTPHLPAMVVGDTVMMAWDGATGKLWFGRNGVWVGDPAAGTTPAFTTPTGFTYYPGMSGFTLNHKLTIRALASNQLYAPPTGFSPAGAI